MKNTKHFLERMGQRSIRDTDVDLVMLFGEADYGDKVILDKKRADELLADCRKVIKRLERIRSRGGITVVSEGGYCITAYTHTKKKYRKH